MKDKVKELFAMLKTNKKLLYVLSLSVLVLFALALNVAFSAFTNTASSVAANIKIKGMEYAMSINGKQDTILASSANDEDVFNLTLTALNTKDSKYELIYHICSDSVCSSYIETPSTLKVEYSSKSVDTISGTISSNGTKTIRIVTTNTGSEDIYIKLDLNAGYSYNTLALQNMINSEFDESDVSIIAYVNGELTSSGFPTTAFYIGNISCTSNGKASDATGKAYWKNNKWNVDIYGAKESNTRCTVNFVNASFGAQKVIAKANTSQGSGGVIQITQPDTNQLESTEEYRYYGSDPSNYVSFNNELWRIIGAFNVENENGNLEPRLKLVLAGKINGVTWSTSASYVNSGLGINEWSNSSIMNLLNPGYEGKTYNNSLYYNRLSGNCFTNSEYAYAACDYSTNGLIESSKNIIDKAKYYTAGWNTSEITSDDFYKYERGSTLIASPGDSITRNINWIGYVGLIYPSDYGYAADPNSCSRTTKLYNYNTCRDYDWLYQADLFTMTPLSNYNNVVFYIPRNINSGCILSTYTSNHFNFSPVVYLKYNVDFSSGTGTSADPYILSLS